MNDLSLIIDLLRRGFQLSAHNGELHFRANKGELMSSERERLAQSKEGIIAFLGNDRKYVRASFAQQRIWFSNQLDPSSPTFNGSASQFHIGGTVEVEAFERALNIVAERHEILRTRFTSIIGQIVQVVEPHTPVKLEQFDLSHVAEADRDAELTAMSAAFAKRPFNLEHGPLWRPILVRLSETESFFILSMHHVVSDGWSVSVFLEELGAAYEAECAGTSHSLPDLPVQYGDYSRWQAQWEGAEAWEESLRFWRKHLGNDPVILELPGDRPRPAESNHEGAAYTFAFPERVVKNARQLARDERATFFMLMMAAFQTVLHRLSGQDSFQVGTPTTGRTPETEKLIGAFINMMAIRADLKDDPTFRDVLRRVQQDLIAASEYQDTPFEEIVRELRPNRDAGVSPIFQSMLVFRQEAPDSLLEFGGLTLSKPIEVSTGTSKYDLTLVAVLDGDTMSGMFEYKTEIFDESTIARIAEYFINMLADAAEHPSKPVSQLRLMNDTEQASVLRDWQGAVVSYPSVTLDGLLSLQASRTPSAVAVSDGSGSLTYSTLDARVNGLAHELVSLGVGPETLVGVYMDRSVDLVVALYAVLRAGGAYVPLDPGYPEARLAYMLSDADAPVVLTQSHLRGSVPAGFAGRVVCVDECRNESTTAPVLDADDARLAYVIYTSGSTGQPKGVMNEHRGVVNRILWMQDAFAMDEQDTVLQKTPFSFDVSVWEFFWPLSVGAKLVMAKPEGHKDPAYLAETIARESVTTIHFVPSMLQAFLDAADTARCTTLQRVICSGEALSVPLHDQFFAQMDCELHNLYGPTEAAVDVTHWVCTPMPGLTNVPIGKPIANTQTYVLDDRLNPVPVGVAGELYLGGVQVARGYWGQAALTAERFIDDPFSDVPGARLYKTGDRCRWRADGAIEFLGRLDAQVKVRGFRIEPGEIESVLRDHDSIHHAVVDTRLLGGESQLVAYLVADREIPAADLRAHVCATLPDHMAPQAYVYLDALPLTPSGKLDRKALPEPQSPESAAQYAPPRNDTETTLVNLWQTLLQTEPIGINDNFFELGGHSLKAVQLVNRIGSAFETALPVRAVFESPTIARLAARIGRESAGPEQNVTVIPKQDPASPITMSFAQQRLWFLDQLDTQRAAYNIPVVVRLDGTLNVDAMRRAIEGMVARHETLRTVFDVVDGQPTPRIESASSFPFESINLQSLDVTEREARVHDFVTAETRDPFFLDQGPLIRAKVLQLSPNEYRLLLTMHHIVSDGWSLGVIVRELSSFYAAECENRDADLLGLAIQYRDFAAWQQERLASGALDSQLAYWKEQLDDVPVLALPTDRPRPSIATHPGATHHFQISKDLNAGITKLSHRLEATPFMTFLAAFNAVLSRMAGQTDIAVGTPVAGRTHESLEALIGLFVNTLVVRTDCSKNPRFDELVARVRDTAMAAFEHQELPFERLVEVLQPDRRLNQNPLFQVMFVFQNAPIPPLELPGLKMTPLYAEGDSAKFDITFVLRESDNGLDGHIEYNTDLFDSETIATFAERFLRVLDTAVAQPESTLASLPVLSEEEEHLLRQWNQTEAPFPDDTTLHGLFERCVDATPTATAVTMAETSLTYHELNECANRVARHLADAGVADEELIGICVDRGIDTVALVIGVWKAGAAFIPLDPEYPEERIAFMVRDSGMARVITAPAYEERMRALNVETFLADALQAPTTTESLRATSAGPETLAYAIYTSGSTGNPKAALIEHRGACNLAMVLGKAFGIESGTRFLQFAPFSFDAWIADFVASLCHGGTLCITASDERLGDSLGDFIDRERINAGVFPPSALMVLPRRAYASLHVIGTGGEACPESLVKMWGPGRTFINAYGPTEITVCSSYYVCNPDENGDPPIGPPNANYLAYVLDANGARVPPGTPGELYIGGVGVARGYLNRPELTAERFLPDPFLGKDGARMYRSGDLVQYREDGTLIFLGRTDHQVKVRGFRIELGDIESALRAHAAVDDAVCIVQRSDATDARIVAYAQIGSAAVSVTELRDHLAARLPSYMVPNIIQTLESLPRTPNGKVDRKALPDPSGADSHSGEAAVSPRNERERAIRDVWIELLRMDNVGIHDNFFDSGGHSLLAVNLVAKLHDIGVTLSLQQVFEHPTIAEMAEAAAQSPGNRKKPDGEIIVPIQPKGDAAPLFAFPPAGGTVFPYYHLAHLLGTSRPFYGIQEPALQYGIKPLASIEEYAEYYLAHIRRIQPTGPYHLLGWSLGGSIAYEMARQIEAAGDTVSFLGLIDTRIHDRPEHKGFAARCQAIFERIMVGLNTAASVPAHVFNGLYVKMSNVLQHEISTEPSIFEKFKRRSAAFTLRVVLRNTEFARSLPKEYQQIEVVLPEFGHVTPLLRAHTKIDLAYRPGKYGGTLTLFRAEELIRGEREHPSEAFGWDALVDHVNVRMVPGNHANMMSEPHIHGLAASINESLATSE